MITLRFRFPVLIFAALLGLATVRAAAPDGAVTGTVTEAGSGRPLEFVAVALQRADGTVVQNAASDRAGKFTLEQVPPGEYPLAYGAVGVGTRITAPVAVHT